MMKRLLLVLTVALMMAAMMVVSAMPAFAFANPDNNGKANVAPGQDRASENCGTFPAPGSPGTGVVGRQATSNIPSNGHQVNGTTAPTNCNHFFQ